MFFPKINFSRLSKIKIRPLLPDTTENIFPNLERIFLYALLGNILFIVLSILSTKP